MTLEATSIWFGILVLFGGLGMFLYGMILMNEGLQLAAGDRLRRMLETFTKTRYRGLAAGAGVTALIQSSSATTVMLVGFVNAGLMTFTQSLGVILGADIGTTITAQMVAFNVILYLSFPCIGIGLLLYMVGNRRVVKYSGEIVLGFGLLFLGMEIMKGAMAPLKSSGVFESWVSSLGNNWFLGVLLGIIITSIVQSSSATTSLVVAMGATGLLSIGGTDPLSIAIPVILGCNIGTCITAWIASIGTSLPAKRVAWAHYIFKIGGVIIVLPFLAWLPDLVRWVSDALGTGSDNIGRQIAWAHTIFNVLLTMIFLPFLPQFAALIKKIKKGTEPEILRDPLFLDPRIFHSPAVALEMARKEITRMGRITLDMLRTSLGYLKKLDRGGKKYVLEMESIVDGLANSITEYLSKLSQEPLTNEQSEQLVGFMHAVNDIERIGDHAENIMYLAVNKMESGEGFTESAAVELDELSDTVFEMYGGIVEAFETQDSDAAGNFQNLEHLVDEMASRFRDNHLKRLNRGECNGTVGVIYLDTLSNLERVGDLANNVGHVTTGELQKL
ncbi:MAG: Na/Pi cotransporter family protein [Actinomycetota bacterium]|nr:Na/Pi cotransporter family protein [Actinomycetota bacterium]MDD5667025.1 Na/Pi cotransporter family protein [Actinomycetota bacterium]